MSLFLNKLCCRKGLNSCKVLSFYVANRGGAHWFPQYKPGPYPKTEEERVKAAKKYNLLPEEYVPYPDDGDGLGDYPQLPEESPDNKDAWYPWDDPYSRRDFGEPIHPKYVALQPELFSNAPDKAKTVDKVIIYLFKFGVGLLFSCYLYKFKTFQGVTERQIWDPNTVHYTFELDHSQKAPEPQPVEVHPPKTPYPKTNLIVPFFPVPLSSKWLTY